MLAGSLGLAKVGANPTYKNLLQNNENFSENHQCAV